MIVKIAPLTERTLVDIKEHLDKCWNDGGLAMLSTVLPQDTPDGYTKDKLKTIEFRGHKVNICLPYALHHLSIGEKITRSYQSQRDLLLIAEDSRRAEAMEKLNNLM